MSTKTKGLVAERFRVAKRQFERWRQGYRRPGRIPTELWVLAAEAAEEVGVEEAARQLQVSAERQRQGGTTRADQRTAEGSGYGVRGVVADAVGRA